LSLKRFITINGIDFRNQLTFRGIIMKKIICILTISLLVLILFIPMTTTSAKQGLEGKDWEKPNDSEKKIKGNNRVIQFKVWDDGVTVSSMGKDRDSFNVFFFTLKLDRGVFLHYNYFRTSFSDEANEVHKRITENRTFPEKEKKRSPPPNGFNYGQEPFEDLGFSILMRNLKEISETSRDVTIYNFDEVDFTKPKVNPIKQDGTVTGLRIRTFTEDGIFGLTFYLISTAQYGQERGISPFEVKYDISIKNFPFKADDSVLALKNIFSFPEMILEDPRDRKFDKKPLPPGWIPPSKERTLGYDMETVSLFFSWATNVTVDGEDHNVTAEYTVSVEGDSTMVEGMTFIYPQGQFILHDPKIGVADLLEIADDTTEFIELLVSWSTGLGIGVVLVALVAVRMKPSKFDWED
jgi:hypothetical protein